MKRSGDALNRLDALLGGAVESGMAAHHRRRLAGLGWSRALDPPTADLWLPGYPPPRVGNEVRVLIDGSEVLPQIAAAIAGARSHVSIAGWALTPGFQLTRGAEPVVLRELLAEMASRVDVRVLLWAGAPVPLFRPWRREVRRAQRELVEGTRIRSALDARERPLHSHHQKVVIVDDEVAFVGGLDLTDIPADRFDLPSHPLREQVGWHDLTAEVRGPVVADIAEHSALRWRAITGERLEPAVPSAPSGAHAVQFAITNPEKLYDDLPRGSFRILEAYVRALRSAQHLIYLENQFLWSVEIVAVLREKLLHPPTPEFRMVMVLPGRPNNGGDYSRGQLGVLERADRERRLLTTTLYAREGDRSRPVYVHAKLGIVDDRWLTVGSANLNDHSLFNDTEANIIVQSPDLIRATRQRLWAEHLELPLADVSGDPTGLIDQVWRPIAEEQGQRQKQNLPLTHRLVGLPHRSRRSARLLGPLQGLVVDG
jgi:phosphatidylserine/phosphatidylglycerophosphate/cardiolipin synthase-like enzyme